MLGDLAHMVERLLRMREALGSIPRISILMFFRVFYFFLKEIELATCIDPNDGLNDDNQAE